MSTQSDSNQTKMAPDQEAAGPQAGQLPRWLYFVAVAIGSVMLVIIVILILLLVGSSTSDNQHKCQLSSTVPDVKSLLANTREIASENRTVLASMVGYLFLYDRGFVPMELNKVVLEYGQLELMTECATLNFNYRGNDQNKGLVLDDIRLDLPDGLSCTIGYSAIMLFPNIRQSCRKKQSLVCRRAAITVGGSYYMQPVAELVLEIFELELSNNFTTGQVSDKLEDSSNCREWQS